MTKYAKLINEKTIEFAPKNKGSIINYDTNVPLLIQDGYKEFVEAYKEQGKVYDITYVEQLTQILEIATEIIPDPQELLENAKINKYTEALEKANKYIISGEALFELAPGKHIEATDGNIGKFSAYALGYITGKITDTIEWTTKEDEVVELNQEAVTNILLGLGFIQKEVWTVKFPAYVEEINAATKPEEVYAIVIDYTV